MSKSYILYKDIAPGAAEDAAASSVTATGFSDLDIAEDRTTPPYLTLELNRWLLNGSSVPREDHLVAFWSAVLSGEDGTFANPPSIEISFDEQYSSTGLTFAFDTATGEYCSLVHITWYQGETLLSERDFEPDSDFYFCENLVESYNKIVVTINKTALPYRRARINRIVFGRERKFGMTELRSVGITNEMDLSSIELPVSVMDWGLESKEPVVFMFQFKQPVECLQDDRLIGVYYVDDHKRLSSGRYTINCVDALGILEESPFPGGVYADKSAKTILEEIADGDFQFLFEVDDVSLTGAILSTTKREAIQQVLFAAGWCLSTDGRYDLRVFEPTEAPYSIGMDRTFPGVSVETSAIVTAVTVVSHAYTQDSSGSVEINGVKYSDTQTEHTVVNTDVTVNTKKNIKTVRGATLVSPDIGQAVAQRLYDYYSRRNALSAKFVWQGERLGDCVTQPIPWGTEETGHIVRMDIRLSNTVVADGRSLGA